MGLGGGGGISAREWPWGWGFGGRGGGGGRGNRFYGRFLGRGGVFWWWVVGIYRKKLFAVVRPLKRLFDSTPPPGAQNKRGRFIFPPPR